LLSHLSAKKIRFDLTHFSSEIYYFSTKRFVSIFHILSKRFVLISQVSTNKNSF
jgi:hypothetical protein